MKYPTHLAVKGTLTLVPHSFFWPPGVAAAVQGDIVGGKASEEPYCTCN